jgi:hypothetical protein
MFTERDVIKGIVGDLQGIQWLEREGLIFLTTNVSHYVTGCTKKEQIK